MKSYYADFWELFGLTPITIWDLPAGDFFAMALQADQVRRETARNAADMRNHHGK
ncbi:MAG TPA: hypothetical protein VEM32_06580 [Geobacteraceae bacterium]|nr:hypothetical protein [Geobacteraceae bacterium]